MRNIITAAAFALCVIFVAAPAFAHNKADFEGSAVKSYSKSYDSFEFSYYMDKVNAIFFTEEFKAKHPMANFFEALVHAVGYDSFDRFDVYSEMTHGDVRTQEIIWLNESNPDSFIYRWMQVPDKEWCFPKFISKGDYVFLMAVNGVKEKGPILMDYMNNVGKAAEMIGQGQGRPMMNLGPLGMIQLNDEMKAALGDEMDLVFFDAPDIIKPINGPEAFNAAVMMPVNDYRVVKKMLAMAGGMAGFDVEKPGFASLGWSFYPLMGTSAAIGLNHEWLVLTTDYKKFSDFAKKVRYKELSPVPKANTYISLDMNRLYRELGMPVVEKLKSENPKLAEKEIAFFFDIAPDTDLGFVTMMEQHSKNKVISTVTMNDDVYNIFGYMFSIIAEQLVMEQMGLTEESCST